MLFCFAALFIAGCGGGGGTIDVTIGGTVAGLSGGDSVVLLDNGTNALTVSANGSFSFPTQIQAGSTYDVTVSTQPSAGTCSVTSGVGLVGANSGNVTGILVNCTLATNYVTGTISGLTAGNTVTLLNNGTDSTTVTQNGPFSFPTPLSVRTTYNVIVSTQTLAPAQTCVVTYSTATQPPTVPPSGTTDVQIKCT
ncbi:MAG: hypothetical protein ACHP7O_07845 [Burkholderiales bacterium]